MSDEVKIEPALRGLLRADWAAIKRASPDPLTYVFPQYFATIEPGLRLTHTGGIVVGTGVVAGADMILYSGVLLGNYGPNREGQPTIGDGVRVRSKASILGLVQIGDGALIGAHAQVVDDVPAGAPMAVAR